MDLGHTFWLRCLAVKLMVDKVAPEVVVTAQNYGGQNRRMANIILLPAQTTRKMQIISNDCYFLKLNFVKKETIAILYRRLRSIILEV